MITFLAGLILGLLIAFVWGAVREAVGYYAGLRDGCNGAWYRLAKSKRIVRLPMGNKDAQVDDLVKVGMN